MLFLSAFMVWWLYQWLYAFRLHKTPDHGHLKRAKLGGHRYCQTKPVWVKKRVIRLKALMPQAGCRTIAHAFNRMHEHKGMTVGKVMCITSSNSITMRFRYCSEKSNTNAPKSCPSI